ncbi:mother-specific HO expression [Lecanora helva]
MSAEAPKLQLDELFSPTMTLPGYKHLFSEPSTPDHHHNNDSPVLSTNGIIRSPSAEPALGQRDHHTPTRIRPRSDSRLPSPPPQDADVPSPSPNILSELGTPTSELGSLQWSAAVGRATTGKSGRVIEKLMGDNDRLQREKALATAKLEEEVKRGESARSALESLQISNANLLSIHETDKTFLAKKDRRIDELRADLEAERSRRERAERETRESRRERDEIVETLRREAAEDKQLAQRAGTQYEVLSKSWKSLEERYEKQTAKLKVDLKELQDEIGGDKRKLAQLEVILEQLGREGDKSRKTKEKLSSDFQSYKAEQEAGIQSIKQRAETNNTAHDRTLEQMESVLVQMRYVVNITKDVHREADNAT